MADQDEVRSVEQELKAHLKRIWEIKPGKATAGVEAQYGQAYQRLVRMGAKPQIRHKYRTG